jgi:hypothetical protein
MSGSKLPGLGTRCDDGERLGCIGRRPGGVPRAGWFLVVITLSVCLPWGWQVRRFSFKSGLARRIENTQELGSWTFLCPRGCCSGKPIQHQVGPTSNAPLATHLQEKEGCKSTNPQQHNM